MKVVVNILPVFFIFMMAVKGEYHTIQLSPDGDDTPNCGDAITGKCQTIDYALNRTQSNNITLILESSPTMALKYTISPKQPTNRSLFLRVVKDNKDGMNPLIHGNTSKALYVNTTQNLTIHIDSIDLHGISLIKNHINNSRIHVRIINSSALLGNSNFIDVDRAKELSILFQGCLLQSSYILDEETLHVDKYLWLNISTKSTQTTPKTGQVFVIETTIRGGRFSIANVLSFNMSKCNIEKNIPKILSKQYFYYGYLRKKWINVTDISQHPGTALNLNHSLFISPNNFMILRNVTNISLADCYVKNSFLRRLLSIENSVGSITNLTVYKTMMFKLLDTKGSRISLTNINTDGLIGHHSVDLFEEDLIKVYAGQLNLTNIRIQNSKISSPLLRIMRKSSISGRHVFIHDTEVDGTAFRIYHLSNLELSDFKMVRTKCEDSVFYLAHDYSTGLWSSGKSLINIQRVSFVNSTWETYQPLIDISDAILTINDLQIDNSKSPGHVIAVTFIPVHITKLKIRNSIFNIIFQLQGCTTYLTDIQIKNTEIDQQFISSTGGDTFFDNGEIISSQILDFVSFYYERKAIFNNITIEGCIIKNNAYDIKNTKMTAINLTIKHSSVINHAFYVSESRNLFIGHLHMLDNKIGNILKSKKSNTKLSDIVVKDTKIINVLFQSKVSFNAFVFSEETNANVTGLKLYDSEIWSDTIFVEKSRISLTDVLMEKNTYSTSFTTLYSEVNITNFRSVKNKASRSVNFINGMASSVLHLSNIFAHFTELTIDEKVVEISDAEIYFNDVHFQVERSSAFKFQVLKMNFETKDSSMINNLTVQCPMNQNTLIIKDLDVHSLKIACQKCAQNAYPTISAGRKLNISTLLNKTDGYIFNNLENTVLECQICPTGGICSDGGIKARDNFYGFMNKRKEYDFFLCPDDYCCKRESNACNSPTTCSFNRTGPLCGECVEDHFVNLNNDCIHNSKCKPHSQRLFWTFFLLIPITIAFLLTYANHFKVLVIRFKRYICCKKRKEVAPSPELESSNSATQNDSSSIECTRIEKKEISLAAIFNIIMTFYQLKALITVNFSNNSNVVIEQIFNIELIYKGRIEVGQLCSYHGMTVITREFLKGYGTPVVMILTVFVCSMLSKLYHIFFKSNNGRQQGNGTYYLGYYTVLAFSYKDICRTAFSFVNCKSINEQRYLYINGNIQCFEPWQIANLVFLAMWVFPFPIAVALSFQRLRKKLITPLEFVIYLTFPFISLIRLVMCKKTTIENNPHFENTDNVQEEISKQPYKEKYVWWEAWRLMERFIIAAFSVFLTNPIYRILYITTVFGFFWYLHSRINPYKRTLFILKRLDSVSWVCLFLISLLNAMRAVAYIYNIPNIDTINYALKAADILEQIFSPLWYLVVSYFCMRINRKLKLQ